MMKRIALSFLLASTLAVLPSGARADHKSPLADAPAIRKRVELRDKRFEVGVAVGTTVNETFYHDILLNAHLAFHITDWLAIGGAGLFNATSLATGFHDELASTLKNPQPDDRAPEGAAAGAGMNKPSMILAGQVELTPFTGKFSLFGKLFAHYDFFLFGGPAYVTLVKANSATVMENGANITECVEKSAEKSVQTCYHTGGALGATFGGGLHAYFNDFVGMSAELRDTLIKDNPTGRDVNGDQYADKRDLNWAAHWTVTLGVTVFFPKADISP